MLFIGITRYVVVIEVHNADRRFHTFVYTQSSMLYCVTSDRNRFVIILRLSLQLKHSLIQHSRLSDRPQGRHNVLLYELFKRPIFSAANCTDRCYLRQVKLSTHFILDHGQQHSSRSIVSKETHFSQRPTVLGTEHQLREHATRNRPTDLQSNSGYGQHISQIDKADRRAIIACKTYELSWKY